ncbi:MAG: carboxypeptidase M32 [Anaerolineae bacterium]
MEKQLAQLKQRLGRIADIAGAMSLLSWDQEVNMPPGGTPARADQMAAVGGLVHEMSIDEELGALLEELNSQVDSLPFDSDDASLIRVTWRDYQKRVKLPPAMVAAFYAAAAMARQAWKEARAKDDFSLFQPHLERLIDMELEMAALLGGGVENPYDALVDYFEPGLTYAAIQQVFDTVKPELVELVRAIGKAPRVDDSMMHGHFPADQQLAFGRMVAEKLGYNFERGRMDLSAHPFTSGASLYDVRITTRVDESFFPSCLFSVIHEAGHAIHFQQQSPTLYRTGIGHASLSICESQSRFYENILGRSRPFWRYFYPLLQEAIPSFRGVPLEAFYRAINRVEPSLIRVEADEVTYGLHIMLRFELENAVINGRVKAADLPAEWNARMEQYLGIVPPNDAQGVLQDIHWSQMPMGYFPTYLLGSIFSAQLWEKLLEEHPSAPAEMEAGDYAPITAWLGQKVHTHGGKFTLPEMAERAVGAPLSSEPYLRYLKAKYSDIYGLS